MSLFGRKPVSPVVEAGPPYDYVREAELIAAGDTEALVQHLYDRPFLGWYEATWEIADAISRCNINRAKKEDK